jgi:apolipoprotein N-acyltransferase
MIKLKIYLSNYYIRLLYFFLLWAIYVFAFTPYNFPIAFVLSIGLVSLLIKKINSNKEFLTSLLAYSAGMCIFGFYWILYAIKYMFPNNVIALLIFVGFILLYSLFLMPTWWLIYINRNKNNYISWFIFILAWCAYEVTKYYFFGGFPWFMNAQIWDFSQYMLQIVSVIGVLGFSVLSTVLTFNIFIILFVNINLRIKFLVAIITTAIVIIIYIYGYIRINNLDNGKNDIGGNVISLKIVNTEITQDNKYSNNKLEENFYKILDIAFSDNPNNDNDYYIILPEVTFGFILEDRPDLFRVLKNRIPKNATVFMGALKYEEGFYYNSFYVISGKTKELMYYYDKVRLVPFGEYLPLLGSSPKFNRIASLLGFSSLTPGLEQTYYDTDLFRVIPLICFEGVFPVDSQIISKNSLIINIANEAWFDNSNEKYQMVSLLRLRAIESGVNIVKSSNMGISVVIDGFGNFIHKNNSINEDFVYIDLTIDKKSTIYSNIADIVISCILFLLYGISILFSYRILIFR